MLPELNRQINYKNEQTPYKIKNFFIELKKLGQILPDFSNSMILNELFIRKFGTLISDTKRFFDSQ
jgi:hypothetical protein